MHSDSEFLLSNDPPVRQSFTEDDFDGDVKSADEVGEEETDDADDEESNGEESDDEDERQVPVVGSGSMEIVVMVLGTQRTWRLKCNPSDSIGDVKKSLHGALELPASGISSKLIYAGAGRQLLAG